MDRRNFFQLAAGSALVAFQNNAIERAEAASRSVKDKTAEEVASDEDYWAEIRNAFPHIPIVAIGGITPDNVGAVARAGADAAAVVSAVVCAEDMRAATAALVRAWSA